MKELMRITTTARRELDAASHGFFFFPKLAAVAITLVATASPAQLQGVRNELAEQQRINAQQCEARDVELARLRAALTQAKSTRDPSAEVEVSMALKQLQTQQDTQQKVLNQVQLLIAQQTDQQNQINRLREEQERQQERARVDARRSTYERPPTGGFVPISP